ncbi:amino acid ABC transporter permease [Proteiniclasticum sp. SCR006]|uniref:Amino acid ABC transporter permease n=1 Tax=Proteiniclasticum aestuarii TaxID=2817862 RepID=A0A939KK38_9CLOT|nr:amino acid ABC transporter permease [Proteiniclasticum aestuarii]MBO1264330.1 amino acid ABC transporter permease [Proteiniclasticum aestuarii]
MINMLQSSYPMLLQGLGQTLFYFIITLLTSSLLGVLVTYLYGFRRMRPLISFYISIVRGTPLLLQLIFIFFGLPYFGITLDRMTAALIGFTFNYTGYIAEILRGGIQSVPQDQKDVAFVLGFSKSYTFYRILLPLSVRNSFPSLSNEVLVLLKDTALIYALGLSELIKVSRTLANLYVSATPFIIVGLIYFTLSIIIEKVLKKIEKNMRKVTI